MRIRTAAVALLLALLSSTTMAEKTSRAVSLDYCADQYLLKMLPREQILALSPDANKHFSYMREYAEGLPTVRPRAEDVLGLKPDLVIRSYGGGPGITSFLQRAGIKVLQIPYAGSFADIRSATGVIADGLGVPQQGEVLIAEMDTRLAHVASRTAGAPKQQALYMTPTGVTSGPGTLVHNMLQTAGYENFVNGPGWRSLPLERLAYQQPDLVVAAFFDIDTVRPERWSAMRHPVAQRQLQDRRTVMLQGAWVSCGAWFLLDAVEVLANK